MAIELFLKIDGIAGESTDDRHAQWIDLLTFTWGVSAEGTVLAGGGAGAGKVKPQDVSFVKFVDKASPALLQSCLAGKHFPKAELAVVRAGGKGQQFLTITLSDVLVSSYRIGGSEGDDQPPTDQFTLDFRRIAYAYQPQKADGSLGSAVDATWDFHTSKP